MLSVLPFLCSPGSNCACELQCTKSTLASHRGSWPSVRTSMGAPVMTMECATGGAKKRRAVKVTGETRVFEEGQLGEAPGGGSLSTYRELCALATEMGQPDLLYKFMDLANHAAALNSSRGAAFGSASLSRALSNCAQNSHHCCMPFCNWSSQDCPCC